MSDRSTIRAEAQKLRNKICEQSGLDVSALVPADEFIRSTLNYLGLESCAEHPDSANLHGSLAVLEDDVVFFDNTLEPGFREYCIAHETGHFVLHRFKAVCERTDLDGLATEDEPQTSGERLVGYGPHERREREANLFALELLLPCRALRDAFVNGLDAGKIANRTGMPVHFVRRQLMHALLIPDPGTPLEETNNANGGSIELDPSQKRAVEAEGLPVLVSAGPGTGKTETLIRRIVRLLERGANPQRILALTFSNKAAGEMRERIAEARPEDAAKIPIMTFHSFGLNLLRRYWKEAGVEKDSAVLDQTDALLLLERRLSELNLNHYLQLVEPVRNLAEVLTAISRAKDELCSPGRYRQLAERMLAAAENDRDVLKAEKALESASVYDYYQRLFEKEKLLDFGDLILRPAQLLQKNRGVRNAVRGNYDGILVDEFQDVNRASGVLLTLIAGKGKGLWAVGDLRQSIYRWRGASPANLKKFPKEYSGARTLSLETNYRSLEPIVRTFGAFGEKMIACEDFNEWEVFRGAGPVGSVTNEETDTADTEAERIAARIRENLADGIPFSDQAVICRSHAQLIQLSKELSGRQIPVFYLGQLFERDEVRDLLSLLDLATSKNAQSMIRVGAFDEYGLSVNELHAVARRMQELEIPLSELSPDDPELRISEEARKALSLLSEHASVPDCSSAYGFLSEYLFSRSGYLKPLLDADDVVSKQILIAIYQFLSFAASVERRFASSERPIPEFLRYVKRLAIFREQKGFAEVPAAAASLDAVRLLTVHGAKGLEFGAVFIPFLNNGRFPTRRRAETCPTPPDLRPSETDEHLEEEECLFFVALSRARDRVHLSRSVGNGARPAKRSPFLATIEEILPEATVVTGESPQPKHSPTPSEPARTDFYAGELDRYRKCGRQFFYHTEMGLGSAKYRSAYQKLHHVIFETLKEIREDGTPPEQLASFAADTLDRLWAETDIDEHQYSGFYREKAERLLETAVRRYTEIVGTNEERTFRIRLGNGSVKVSPTSLEVIGAGDSKQVIARLIKTGKAPSKPDTKDSDAVLMHALQSEFPNSDVSLRKLFLTDDDEQEMKITERVIGNRIAKYEEAIDGINRGDFSPDPSDYKCPSCPYYFICESKTTKKRKAVRRF